MNAPLSPETMLAAHLARRDAREGEAIRRITDAWSLLVSEDEARQAAIDLVTILLHGDRDAPVAIVALDLVERRARNWPEWAAVPESHRDCMAVVAANVWVRVGIGRPS